MSAQRNAPPLAIIARATPEELATGLRLRFEDYNDEFAHITRRAAQHFQTRDWPPRGPTPCNVSSCTNGTSAVQSTPCVASWVQRFTSATSGSTSSDSSRCRSPAFRTATSTAPF